MSFDKVSGCKSAKALTLVIELVFDRQCFTLPVLLRTQKWLQVSAEARFTIRLSWRSINHKSLAWSFARWWISEVFSLFGVHVCLLKKSHSFIGLSSPTRETQPCCEVQTDVSRKCKYRATLKSVFTAQFNCISPLSDSFVAVLFFQSDTLN